MHFLVRTMSIVDTSTLPYTQALKQERQLLLWRVVGASFSKTPIPRSTVLSENIKKAERASFGDRGPGNAQKGTRMSVRKRDFALQARNKAAKNAPDRHLVKVDLPHFSEGSAFFSHLSSFSRLFVLFLL